MEPINKAQEIRRELASRRLALALAIVLGILCGLLVLFRPGLPPESRQYEVWLSQAALLVDTSDSQLVDARALGFEAIATRATLLGNLIATGPLKDRIADRAGVPADDLVVVPPATEISAGAAAPAPEGIPDAEVTKLTATADPSLPILRIAAQAPDAKTAALLSRAAAEELRSYVASVAARQDLPDTRKLVVSELASGAPIASKRGPGPLLAFAVVILVAALGCAAVVLVPRLLARPEAAEEPTVGNGRRTAQGARTAGARAAKHVAPPRPPAKASANGHSSQPNGHASQPNGHASKPKRRTPQPKGRTSQAKASRASRPAKARTSRSKEAGGAPPANRQRARRKPEGPS